MIVEYLNAALGKAKYEIIEDDEPFYGEVPELEGVWATGKTLEECRKNLAEVIEGWIIIRIKKGLPIPPIDDKVIEEPTEMAVASKLSPVSWREKRLREDIGIVFISICGMIKSSSLRRAL